MTTEEFDEAVRTVVCDVLYNVGLSPLTIATILDKVTKYIQKESAGYALLRGAVLGTPAQGSDKS